MLSNHFVYHAFCQSIFNQKKKIKSIGYIQIFNGIIRITGICYFYYSLIVFYIENISWRKSMN